jgi:membrane associated rhomboid family serine protease
MQHSRNLIDEIKHQLTHGTMTNRLIIYNVIVFAIILLVNAVLSLSVSQIPLSEYLFALDTDLLGFIQKPWGILTSIFSHFGLWHLIFNMLFLYFSGQLFEQIFDKRRLWQTYIFAGIAGGLLEIAAHYLFPSFQNTDNVVVGASGVDFVVADAFAVHSVQVLSPFLALTL